MMVMLNRWLLLIVLFTGILSCDKKGNGDPAPPPPANTFSNPLLTTGPDPWIYKKDNNYYYTHTQGNRISLWKTAKVTELNNVTPNTVWNAPGSGQNAFNVWAPEIHFINNKWYIYYTAGSSTDHATQRTFVLENANADPLTGSWTDKGKISDASADLFAIDGTVMNHNGINYFLWSGHASASDKTQRIYIASMSDPWTLSSQRVLISSPQFSWEMVGTPPAVNEGPEVLKNASGKIFVIYSASGCWTDDYALGILTLADGGDPLDPSDWAKSATPVFTKKPSGGVYGPGHNSFFKSPDGTEDWIMYHANSTAGKGCGDFRSPRIQKFTWSSNGTPGFGEPVSIGVQIQKPSGE
jgi:GH43 family beta-xylosidase